MAQLSTRRTSEDRASETGLGLARTRFFDLGQFIGYAIAYVQQFFS